MKNLTMAVLLLASTCAAQAGGSASATMEVSFVIRAACSVQAVGSDAAPRVECSQGTAYQLVRQAAPAASNDDAARQPSSAAQAGDAWQVVF